MASDQSGDSERNRFSSRAARYAKVGTGMSGVAAKMIGARFFGMELQRDAHAGELAAALGNLKGPLMKVAQLLSTIPDALPPEYAAELATLQSDAPPMGWPFVKRRMAAELGADWQKQFASFEHAPAAAASLGQVHRAVGHDGLRLACKLQYPNMDSAVEADLKQLSWIFSIHRRVTAGSGPGTAADCMQKGTEQVAAGYILYGSSTMLVYTTGDGVHGFTLDPLVGEFFLSHENIQIPKRGGTYSVNEGNSIKWTPALREWVAWLKSEDAPGGKPYGQRYIGTLVADFHRTLLKGGIFAYPGDVKNPNGKLRLLYECAPMAFIAEAAGGAATTGTARVLEVEPDSLHARVPFFVGSAEDVADLQKRLA